MLLFITFESFLTASSTNSLGDLHFCVSLVIVPVTMHNITGIAFVTAFYGFSLVTFGTELCSPYMPSAPSKTDALGVFRRVSFEIT